MILGRVCGLKLLTDRSKQRERWRRNLCGLCFLLLGIEWRTECDSLRNDSPTESCLVGVRDLEWCCDSEAVL